MHDHDPVKNLPGGGLRGLSAAVIMQLAARLGALELRLAEAHVLLVIEADPGVTQSEIGRLRGIASANMTPLAARLADRGLIGREAVDWPSQGLTLSEAGRRIAQKARSIMKPIGSHVSARPSARCSCEL